MSINREQTQGLVQVRNKFVSDRKTISDFELGTVHTKLELLTIDDLRYLANFPNIVRHSVVDLELTDDQLADETSPVFDLAAASKKATKAAEVLEERFWKYLKAFNDELKSGFRLESVMAEPKYNTIAKHVGLDIKTVTLNFLGNLDVKEEAQKIKNDIIGQFGFEELAKMYTPGGPAIKLSRLIEESDEMPDGYNPVLFEALAAQIVDDFTMAAYGLHGFVKNGNVILKITPPGTINGVALEAGQMAVIEVGVNLKKFKLAADTQDYFPNVPSSRFSPVSFTPATMVQVETREMESLGQKGNKFLVEAEIHYSMAIYLANFGKVKSR